MIIINFTIGPLKTVVTLLLWLLRLSLLGPHTPAGLGLNSTRTFTPVSPQLGLPYYCQNKEKLLKSEWTGQSPLKRKRKKDFFVVNDPVR